MHTLACHGESFNFGMVLSISDDTLQSVTLLVTDLVMWQVYR